MPLDVALACVPASQKESLDTAAPMAVIVALTPVAEALLVDLSSPLLVSTSASSPPSMAVASAVEFEVDVAPATPNTVMVSLFDTVVEFAVVSISASLLIRSWPWPPSMPLAVASAVVPPSHTESPAAPTPPNVEPDVDRLPRWRRRCW